MGALPKKKTNQGAQRPAAQLTENAAHPCRLLPPVPDGKNASHGMPPVRVLPGPVGSRHGSPIDSKANPTATGVQNMPGVLKCTENHQGHQ